jgi:hypothetical protein
MMHLHVMTVMHLHVVVVMMHHHVMMVMAHHHMMMVMMHRHVIARRGDYGGKSERNRSDSGNGERFDHERLLNRSGRPVAAKVPSSF